MRELLRILRDFFFTKSYYQTRHRITKAARKQRKIKLRNGSSIVIKEDK